MSIEKKWAKHRGAKGKKKASVVLNAFFASHGKGKPLYFISSFLFAVALSLIHYFKRLTTRNPIKDIAPADGSVPIA